METVSPGLGDRLKVIIRNMDSGKMMVVLLLVSAAVAGLIYMATWAGKPDFQYLFTNLPKEDAAGIVARLKEKNIPFQLDGNGSAILVPKQNLHEMRLEMASHGLSQGSRIGFEIFDDVQLGMTDFIQNVNYQRALQGELSRTINKLDEVASSRVHIVIAEKSLFVEEEEPSTASVVVNLHPGKKLRESQVLSIVQLVASSVSRLDMENVTIVDNYGRMLTNDHHQSSSGKVNAEQLAYQRKIESDLETRITSMLESVLGRNKATVRVSCLIDFIKEELTEETYLPENAVIRSEQQMKENSGQETEIAKGIPGMASRAGQEQEPNTTSTERTAPQGFQRLDRTVNYEIGKVVKHRVLPVGRLLRQSVAVVVDGTHDPASSNGKAAYTPRTPEEMAQIEKLVKRAINFDAVRGDEVEVQNIPFQTGLLSQNAQAAPAEPESWTSRLGAYSKAGRIAAAGVFCLLIFLFIVRPLMRWITASSPWDKEIYTQLPKTIAEIESAYAGGGSAAVHELTHVSQAAQMISNDKKNTAQLLQGWMGNQS